MPPAVPPSPARFSAPASAPASVRLAVSSISCFSSAGEKRIVTPPSGSPPPNGCAAGAGTCAEGVPGPVAGGAAGGTAGEAGGGVESGRKPPLCGRPGTAMGCPVGGGGGGAAPGAGDSGPPAFCVYQAGGV
ncbi:hypothetical protein LUW75_04650 [Streptomyces sp. MRC013]|nr:hypothetical protein LUW75_04650 [Streptomyces sp. MRC013]